MVELRKRPAPPPAPEPAAKKKAAAPKTKAAPKTTKASKAAKDAPAAEVPEEAPAVEEPAEPETKEAVAEPTKKATKDTPAKEGETIDLDGFGGEIETNEGQKVTLAQLVQSSKAGVVLFTYPKASTPGCTTQACLFRDSYTPLTATGLAIYGLSTDSPKANTTFKTKQKLPYPLLCDPNATLIQAIGLKKAPKGTTRGVFVVDKSGKVLAAEPGGPAATVEVVKGVVAKLGGDSDAVDGKAVDKEAADTAAEVAGTAEKLDG